MPRQLRRDYPGALHHITNRGIAKRPIFERSEDVRYFLSRLAHSVRRGEIKVHAYGLVTTHFHILAASPRGELATAMARIQGGYSRYFNRRRRRDGPLYRARYYSRTVESVAYQDNLVRYIDANAVEAGLVARPEWHASASAYWYARPDGPPWLSRALLEDRAAERCGAEPGACPSAQRAELYRRAFEPRLSPGHAEWIERRLLRGEGQPDPLDDLIAAAPPTVLAWMRRKAALADGCGVGLPLVPWQAVDAALAARGADARPPGGAVDLRRCSDEETMRAGLFREVGGLTYARIAALVGCSEKTAHYRVAEHRRRIARDRPYADRAAEITVDALREIA